MEHQMIHVQNWKIYASHYDDDSTELGFELKKAQLHYKLYGEQMGVPVTEDIVRSAQRPSVDDIFPYLFDGTLIEDYNQAKYIEQNTNCITVREWHERKGTLIAGGIITGYGVAQMPTTTNINSEYESPLELLTEDSADVSFSDEILGEEENDTPMKKNNCLNMKHHQKQTMSFLDSKIHRQYLVLQQKNYRRVLRRLRLL
jgi:hypothetical protein